MKRSILTSFGIASLALITLAGCSGAHTSPPITPSQKTSVQPSSSASATPSQTADANAALFAYYAKCGLTGNGISFESNVANSDAAKNRKQDDCVNVLNLNSVTHDNDDPPTGPKKLVLQVTQLPQELTVKNGQYEAELSFKYTITYTSGSPQANNFTQAVYYGADNKIHAGDWISGNETLRIMDAPTLLW